MLIEFTFSNYRSFRDKAVLSLDSTALQSLPGCLIDFSPSLHLLPAAAIYGKNGGGKSNVIRAFWFAVQFIRNAQKTQHDSAQIPVTPFLLDDHSQKEPSCFSFHYSFDGIKYWYSFSATREAVVNEELYYSPHGRKSVVFTREGQLFTFTQELSSRKTISRLVAENQLFFPLAAALNDAVCMEAIRWFRESVYFSRDYSDIPAELLEYAPNPNMLRAITSYAKAADLGIEDMQFEIDHEILDPAADLPAYLPEGVTSALKQLAAVLSQMPESTDLSTGRIKASSLHYGTDSNDNSRLFELPLSAESDGTLRMMSLAPSIESVLATGGILLVDEIDRCLHPKLVSYVVSKFQSKNTNPFGAQLIFTTHDMELLNMEIIRKDQVYFADKDSENGVSELYSVSDFETRTTDNIRKGYLLGKFGAVPMFDIEEVV